MYNKLDKDGNHQDMLDKPESNMYACNIDTDNGESTKLKYEGSNSEGKTILRSSQSSSTDSNRNLSAIKVPLP
jgi:hypothetical protein